MDRYVKKQSIGLMILNISASILNYFSNILFGRIMTVEMYGSVSNLLAFLSNALIFIAPIQTLLCKAEASKSQSEYEKELVISRAIKMGLVLIIIEDFIFVLWNGYVKRLLDIGWIGFLLLLFYMFTAFLYFAVLSLMQGRQNFFLYGIMSNLLIILKTLISVFFLQNGCGVESIIIGFLIGYIITALLGIKMWKGKPGIARVSIWDFDKSMLKYYGWSFVLMTLMTFFLNSGDLLLVKSWSCDSELGFYSVAMNLSKTILYFITVIGTILFPTVVSNEKQSERKKALLNAIIVSAIICVMFSIILFILKEFVISFLYGEKYIGAIPYFLPSLVFTVILSLVYIIYQYALADGNLKLITLSLFSSILVCVIIVILMKPALTYVPYFFSASLLCGFFPYILWALFQKSSE